MSRKYLGVWFDRCTRGNVQLDSVFVLRRSESSYTVRLSALLCNAIHMHYVDAFATLGSLFSTIVVSASWPNCKQVQQWVELVNCIPAGHESYYRYWHSS